MKVYLLQHVHALEDRTEDVKIIGVYSSRKNAESAIARLSQMPGFCESTSGCHVDEYQLDKEQWVAGYSTIGHA